MRFGGRLPNIKLSGSDVAAYGIIFLLLAGVIAGAVFSNLMDEMTYHSIKDFMTEFLNSFDKSLINQKTTFIDALLKYSRGILIIWIAGFFAPGLVIIVCAVLSKAFAYGFTTAALVKYFGVYGFIIGFSAYVPQNLIFMPAIFYVAYSALGFIRERRTDAPRTAPRSGGAIGEYALVLLIGLLCCAIAALTETYLTPTLLEYVKPV